MKPKLSESRQSPCESLLLSAKTTNISRQTQKKLANMPPQKRQKIDELHDEVGYDAPRTVAQSVVPFEKRSNLAFEKYYAAQLFDQTNAFGNLTEFLNALKTPAPMVNRIQQTRSHLVRNITHDQVGAELFACAKELFDVLLYVRS
jgi:hypothetical protein